MDPPGLKNKTGLRLFQPHLTPRHINRHTITAQEVVSDDATDLVTEEHARRPQVEDGKAYATKADALEIEIHTGQQECVLVGSGHAQNTQPYVARGFHSK